MTYPEPTYFQETLRHYVEEHGRQLLNTISTATYSAPRSNAFLWRHSTILATGLEDRVEAIPTPLSTFQLPGWMLSLPALASAI